MEFTSTTFSAEADGSLRRVIIFPENFQFVHKKSGTDVLLDADLLKGIAASSEAHRKNEPGGETLFDFNHMTLNKSATPEQKAAAGWITKFEFVSGLGLVALTRFTEKALKLIEEKAFRFVSPVFTLPVTKASRIIQSTLTNTPHINFPVDPILAAERGLTFGDEDKKDTTKKGTKKMKGVAKLLGLQADASEEAILEAMSGRIAAEKSSSDEVGTLKAERDAFEAAKTAAEDSVAKLEATAADAKIEGALNDAQQGGRIAKAERPKWKEDLKKGGDMVFAILEKLPKAHDIGEEDGNADAGGTGNSDEPAWAAAQRASYADGVLVALEDAGKQKLDVERADLSIAAEILCREDPKLNYGEALILAEQASGKCAMFSDSAPLERTA